MVCFLYFCAVVLVVAVSCMEKAGIHISLGQSQVWSLCFRSFGFFSGARGPELAPMWLSTSVFEFRGRTCG